jgi:GNAT superfamily N-acetyltransferase
MIQFRTAQFTDHNSIAQIHADNWKKTYRGMLSDHYLDNEVEEDRALVWHQRLRSPADNQHIILAISEEKVIGFCCIYFNDDPTFGSLIDNLHVAASQQKTGVGRLLLQAAARVIQEKASKPQLYLWVFDKNENAKQFYDRIGGKNYETVEKESFDGSVALVCRYVWEDLIGLF